MWNGECYVFDNRVSLKHNLKVGTYTICSSCRKPVSLDEKRSEKYKEGISCPKCHDELSFSQKKDLKCVRNKYLTQKKFGRNYFFKKEYS